MSNNIKEAAALIWDYAAKEIEKHSRVRTVALDSTPTHVMLEDLLKHSESPGNRACTNLSYDMCDWISKSDLYHLHGKNGYVVPAIGNFPSPEWLFPTMRKIQIRINNEWSALHGK